MACFPLFVDLSDRKIRVFGGGAVATRRVKTLLEFGADVYVVAPEISSELKILAEQQRLTLSFRSYHSGELEQEELVLAATDDPRVNDRIYQECQRKGIWVNVASDKKKCDFYFPGIAKAGEITVGVTAGGNNHRKAAYVTEELRRQLAVWEEKKEGGA